MKPYNYKDTQKIINKMLDHFEISPNGTLLIHSALKGFVRDGYKPNHVLASLLEYMMQGTILFPTMSWRFLNQSSPHFDELHTPSNTGILTELFRQQYATNRSLHPTHSVAGLGKQADALLNTHHLCETPCGIESPFAKLVNLKGYIIMMGVGMDCCSLIHHVEELLAPELYVKSKSETETLDCKDKNGNITHVKLRRHLFLARNYWQFQDIMAANGVMRVFRIDNSICLGFRADHLYQIVISALKAKPDAIIAKSGQRFRLM